jgi:hypothetical protein
VKPQYVAEADRIDSALRAFHETIRPLPGIQEPTHKGSFLEQVVESIRRVRYVVRIRERDICGSRADPASDLFDPIRAAALNARGGRHDEACWLAFLSVHFGKSRQSGWRLPRDIYGALGAADRWDWARTSGDPAGFRAWLAGNQRALKDSEPARRFGNHRKYQSLDAHKPSGTGAAVESYVGWVAPSGTHANLFGAAVAEALGDRHLAFDALYRSMESVASFGRTARFDYLTMIGNLGLAPIEPGFAYLGNATGPLRGARLLFCGSTTGGGATPRQLDAWLAELGARLGLGMQVMEDSLCNWQKSPGRFVRFRG